MLKTNEKSLVEQLVQVQPAFAVARSWQVDTEGKPFILPSVGGITTNIHIGDPAFGLVGDHIEAGVSCKNGDALDPSNSSAHILSCIGNEARIVSGDAKGTKGYVVGSHGGAENLMIEFPKAAKLKMTYDDKIIIRAKGLGLKFLDFPSIFTFNLDPQLAQNLKIKVKGKKLQVPVTTIVPAECMGSGVGAAHVCSGDYDIMTSDKETVKKYNLDKMRFGDVVAIMDHDNRYGRAFSKGAITIGIIVHSDCLKAGHGPGVSTILTSASPSIIEPILDPKSNLVRAMKNIK